MDRIAVIVCSAVLVLLIGAIVFLFVLNPMVDRRVALAAELDKIQPRDVPFEKPKWDFEKWQQAIAAKPALWRELIGPPPPAPPPPPPKPKLEEMIKDYTAGRAQVGGKAMITKKGEKRGTFMGVGDTLNGLTIKEITKKEVVLSLTFNGEELTTSLPRN